MDYALNGFSFWNVELILENQEKKMAENVKLDFSISIWNCHTACECMCLQVRTTDCIEKEKERQIEVERGVGEKEWMK